MTDTHTTDLPDPQAPELDKTFADFGVSEPIVDSLRDVGITHPYTTLFRSLPIALSGHDIIGQAKTGTGKTLGFGIPVLERVIGPGEDGWEDLEHAGKPQALIIVPTRELAIQVAGDLESAAKRRSLRILQVYGGRAYEPQIKALERGVEVSVGAPGRMIDLLNQRYLNLSAVRAVVLDEADEMLDLGFLPDVETLLATTPANRHTMLFSATMPGAVIAMARRYMTRPTHIRAADPTDDSATVEAVTQFAYRAHALDKVELIARVLQARGRGLTIIFVRTKRTAARVTEDLIDRGFAAAPLHGDLGQGAREQALRAFRSGKVDVLVATDVAARGIDVDDVTHVINYQCPEDEKTYLHRIGRTARAGASGTAITLVDWDDIPRWGLIDRATGLGKGEPVETYSSSEHLFTDLDIPEGTKGRLPRSERTRAGLDAEVLEDIGETGGRRAAGPRRGGSGPGGRGGPRRSGSGRGGSGRGGSGRGRSRQRTRRRVNEGGGSQGGAAQGGAAQGGAAQGGSGAQGGGSQRRRRRRTRGGKPTNES